MLGTLSEAVVGGTAVVAASLIGGLATIYVTLRGMDRKNAVDHGRVRENLRLVQNTMIDVRGDIADVKGDVAEVKGDVTEVRSALDEVRRSVEDHKEWHSLHPFGVPASGQSNSEEA